MNRRTLLKAGTGVAAVVLAARGLAAMAAGAGVLPADLEPDRDWPIYRRYRLLIVSQGDDRVASALGTAVVAVLARFLPASRAQPARAADSRRVGVLIGTNQQDVAIMTAESAEALFLAKQPFADIRNVPLRIIVSFGSHVLVCREDLVSDHVYLLARTLTQHKDALGVSVGAPEGVVPAHRGSRAFFAGARMPTPTNSA